MSYLEKLYMKQPFCFEKVSSILLLARSYKTRLQTKLAQMSQTSMLQNEGMLQQFRMPQH